MAENRRRVVVAEMFALSTALLQRLTLVVRVTVTILVVWCKFFDRLTPIVNMLVEWLVVMCTVLTGFRSILLVTTVTADLLASVPRLWMNLDWIGRLVSLMLTLRSTVMLCWVAARL